MLRLGPDFCTYSLSSVWTNLRLLLSADIRLLGYFFGIQVWDREKVIIILGHYIFTSDEHANRNADILRDFCMEQNIKYFYYIKDLGNFKILHFLGNEGPKTSDPSKYIRYIYYRVILENATIQASAVSTLAMFGALIDSLKTRIFVLLRRCLFDIDDEVRDLNTLRGDGVVGETDMDVKQFHQCFGSLGNLDRGITPNMHVIKYKLNTGEETSAAFGTSELTDPTWIVDPLDGTTNFVHRSFCVSIGLTIGKVPTLVLCITLYLKRNYMHVLPNEGCCDGMRFGFRYFVI